MPEKKRSSIPLWVLVAAGLALLITCAGLLTLGAGVAAFSLFSTASERIVSTAPAPTQVETGTATGNDTETAEEAGSQTRQPPATDTPDSDLDVQPTRSQEASSAEVDPHAARRAQIEANVVAIRNLAPKVPVRPTILSVAELRTRLEEDLLADYGPDEARQDVIVLSAFNFVSPDFDIYNFLLDLYTEQIAGFYDSETDEFVVISDDENFDSLEQWTHAHEYVHALQDQYFDLDRLDDETLDSEAIFALQALAEGEATLVQTFYLTEGYFDQGELLDILTDSLTVDMSVYESAPPVLASELEFPYVAGLNFVETLYEQGGFEAINRAWQDPPLSTEHILHPERYLADDLPQIVALAPLTDTLGSGWELVDEDVLGEFYLREYLAQQLEEKLVETAATGWGGDRYAVYWHEDNREAVMALRLAWDSANDGDEFEAAYADFAGKFFGTPGEPQASGGRCWSADDVICLYTPGDDSLIVRAPDLVSALVIAGVQQGQPQD